jgi:hypothetical protein
LIVDREGGREGGMEGGREGGREGSVSPALSLSQRQQIAMKELKASLAELD